MKVFELKAILAELDDDLEVCFKRNSGDYWRTEVLDEVNDFDLVCGEYSDYHRKLKVIEEEEVSENSVTVVALF